MRLESDPARSLLLGGRRDPDDERDAEPGRLSRGGRARPRVLIVEDEALVALDLENALGDAGFEVLGVVDTEAEAVETTEQLRPDVVLMDITLRRGDGISAARRLAGLRVCIIFVSGNSDPRTLAAAQAICPAGFIRKPFQTDRLPGLIAQIVANPRGN